MKTYPALALLLASAAAPLLPLLSPDVELSLRDIHRIFLPEGERIGERLRRLEFPEWEPAIACGQPVVGMGQSQLFYPPRWVGLVLKPEATLKALAFLHPLFAAAVGFALARRLGRSEWAALVAGSICGSTPLLLSSIIAPNLEYAACWLPFVLLQAVRFAESRSYRPAILGAVGVAMAALAGALEMSFAAGLAFAWLAFATGMPRRALGVALVLVAAVAVLLSAPDWLPLLAHAASGPRQGGLSLAASTRWSLQPLDLVRLLIPLRSAAADSWSDYQARESLLNPVYAGASCLALAGLGARTRLARWSLALAAVMVLLSLGVWGGLFPLLHALPLFNQLRFPAKFALLLGPLLVPAAAAGVDSLQPHWRWLAFALVLTDLQLADRFLVQLPLTSSADAAALRAELPRLEPRYRLEVELEGADWWDLTHGTPASRWQVLAFLPNYPLVGGVSLADGYGPNLSQSAVALSHPGTPAARDLMAVRYLLQRKDKPPEGRVVGDYGSALLVERPRALPRGIFLSRWTLATGEAARERVLAPDFDPRSEVVLETNPLLGSPSEQLHFAEAELALAAPEALSLGVDAPVAGLVLLQDSWDPGWRAAVDGRPEAVLRADSAFMAVPVAPGHHRIELTFRSTAQRAGLCLGALGLLSALALCFLRRPAWVPLP